MNPEQFVKQLQGLSFENTFNPYSSRCPVYDLCDAPQRRSQILLSVLNVALDRGVDSVWIGRDLGHRGGRRTGLPLTDDVHFKMHLKRWGLSFKRPTQGREVPEGTAKIAWTVLSQIELPVFPFLWNVFPLHPHKPGSPFSNRPHYSTERRCGKELLTQLICLLRPRRLIAIGKDAFTTTDRLFPQHDVVKVRHPSFGGKQEFLRKIQELYPDIRLTA